MEPPALGFVELPGGVEMFNPGLKIPGTPQRRRRGASDVSGASGRLGAVVRQTAGGEAAVRLLAWLSGPQWSATGSAASTATTLFRKTHLQSPSIGSGSDSVQGLLGRMQKPSLKAAPRPRVVRRTADPRESALLGSTRPGRSPCTDGRGDEPAST